ncbi:MAG: dephospho-CoA kinase [Candidatus Omnitrophota bacterium]
MQKQKKDKIVLGVTGNIGSGKTTVARMFKGQNTLIINADLLAHKLYLPKTNLYKKIVKIFGEGIIKTDKSIDRKKLSKLVFASKKNLVKLNYIVHPELIKEIKKEVKNSGRRFIVLDAALIVELGLRKMVDKLVLVTANKKQQIIRSQKRLGAKKEVIIQVMKSQISQITKSRFADFIIDNSGSMEKTKKQVLSLRRNVWKS